MADEPSRRCCSRTTTPAPTRCCSTRATPMSLYATLWSQQQSFIEGQGFGNAGMGIFKSTDGGTTWTQLGEGLPPILQANIAIAPSDPNILYAAIAPGQGPIGFYKSTDGGAHWFQAIRGPGAPGGSGAGHAAARPHRRRRPADRHRRSEGSERRLHRVDRDVADDWTAGSRGAPCAALRAATTTSASGSIRTTRRSSSPSPIRARWSPRIAAAAGATGTTRTPRRCITSPPTTRFPIASARGSRTRAAPACRADRTTGASRSTTGIR